MTIDDFASNIDRTGDGCWPWRLAKMGTGYGELRLSGPSYPGCAPMSLEKEADDLGMNKLQKGIFLARSGFAAQDRNQPRGPLDERTRLAAVCRSHIHAGHSKMAAQCARRLFRLARKQWEAM